MMTSVALLQLLFVVTTTVVAFAPPLSLTSSSIQSTHGDNNNNNRILSMSSFDEEQQAATTPINYNYEYNTAPFGQTPPPPQAAAPPEQQPPDNDDDEKDVFEILKKYDSPTGEPLGATLNGWTPDSSQPCFGLPGAIPPLGYFDPLGFCADRNLVGAKRFREAETIHGRVAMMVSRTWSSSCCCS